MHKINRQILRGWLGGLALAALPLALLPLCSASSWAQDATPSRLREFESLGYVMMDDVATPLLHHVMTGENYELRALARGEADGLVVAPERPLRHKASSSNEFERAEANPVWNAYVFNRVQSLRNARGYLIPLRAKWGEYDFSGQRLPVELSMVKTVWKSSASYHCAGAYQQRDKNEYRTACLTAASLNNKDSFVRFFPLADVNLARQIRENPGGFRVLALAEPDGKYRLLHGTELRYDAWPSYVASGLQPVRITALVLADYQLDRVYTLVKNPNAAPAPAPAAEAPLAGAAQPDSPRPSKANQARADSANPWKLVFRSAESNWHTDVSSVRREGGVVVVRELTDYKTVAEDGYRSMVGIYSYNCNQRTVKRMSIRSYTGNMGEGAVMVDSTTPQDLGPVAPGTRGEIMFNFACNAAPSNL